MKDEDKQRTMALFTELLDRYVESEIDVFRSLEVRQGKVIGGTEALDRKKRLRAGILEYVEAKL